MNFALTVDDLTGAERLAGRPSTTEEHQILLLPSLTKTRERLQVLRTSPMAEGMPMATLFRPLLPPVGESANSVMVSPDVTTKDWDGNIESLAFAPVTLLAELLRTHRVTSRQLTEFFLQRLKQFGTDPLFCVITLVPDEIALAEADRADAEIAAGTYRGPLQGIPYGAKDLFATRDMPTTDGVSPFQNRVIATDATTIVRLREAGAVLVAKLSLGELMMDNVWFGGATRNPWSTEAGSSGSSAGSASAVGAGLVPFALGTETWGSIISPCNVCGTTGLRPTFGRVSRSGASALCWSMDKIGPIARSIADCVLVFDVLQGRDDADNATYDAPFGFTTDSESLTKLRVGYDVAAWEALASDKANAQLLPFYDDARAQIETLLGKPLIPVQLPTLTPEYATLPMLIIGVEGAAAYASLIASGGMDKLVQQGPNNWPNLFRTAQTIPATEYIQAQRVRSHLQQAMQTALAEIDVYITIPCVGPSLLITNLTGHPEAITRCGFTPETNQPIMLSVVGDLLREDAALALAHAYEQATDWHLQTPPNF